MLFLSISSILNVIFPSMALSSKLPLWFKFPYLSGCGLLPRTCNVFHSSHFTWFYTLLIFGDKYNSWNFSLLPFFGLFFSRTFLPHKPHLSYSSQCPTPTVDMLLSVWWDWAEDVTVNLSRNMTTLFVSVYLMTLSVKYIQERRMILW